MNWEMINLIVSSIIVLGLFYVGAKASKIDKLQDNMEDLAEKLVNTKFALLAAKMEGPFEKLATIIKGIEQRLERGDEVFDRQGEASHKIELKLATSAAENRNWTMQNFATKEEVKAISEALIQIKVALARVETDRYKPSQN